jgi:hypothetical protein
VDPLQRGGEGDDRAGRHTQALGELVAEAVRVDEREQHRRRQHDDDDAQGRGDGSRRVVPTEQPGRPPHREPAQQTGQEPQHHSAQPPPGPGTHPGGGQGHAGQRHLDGQDDERLLPVAGDDPGRDGSDRRDEQRQWSGMGSEDATRLRRRGLPGRRRELDDTVAA